MVNYVKELKDTIFEGRWKISEYNSKEKKYVLENIYNKSTMTMSSHQLYNVVHGKDTLSKVRLRQACVNQNICVRNSRTKTAKRRTMLYSYNTFIKGRRAI